MIFLWGYLFIGAVYAAGATHWIAKHEAGTESENSGMFFFGLTCMLAWPLVMFMSFIVSGDDG